MTSPLLDGIARAILVILLNGLWQGAVIAGVTWGALRLSPRANASTRYAAWTLALLAMLVVPIVTSLTHINYASPSHRTVASANVKAAPAAAPAAKSEPSTQNHISAAPAHLALPQAPSVTVTPPALLTTALFALWALAAIALTIRLAVALLQLERLKRDSMPLGMEYRERLQQWQSHAEVDRDVRICVTEDIEVPVAVGLFDAMVLLPKHLLETLEASEIDQISLHELAHLLRHDDWTNSFQRVAIALLFFNPAVWFIARQMDIEREVACDDYVLVLTGAVRNYAYCLTKMAEMTAWPHRPLAAPGVFITRKNISIRIERLLRTGRAISSSISPGTAVAVLIGLVAAFAVAGAVTPVVAFALPAAPQAAVERTPATPAPRKAAATAALSVSVSKLVNNVVAKVVAHASVPPMPPVPLVPSLRKAAFTPGCTGCDFSNANLPDKDFRGQNLTGSDFKGANLEGARFDNSNLSGANFKNANLQNASFVNANMMGCDLEGANLSGARFDGARLEVCQVNVRRLAPAQTRIFLTRCTVCDFHGANLSGLDLRGIKIAVVDLSGASLRDTNLSGADFSEVDFSKADFSGANLHGTTFEGCDFSGADLRNVDLTHTDFVGSSLSGARMKP